MSEELSTPANSSSPATAPAISILTAAQFRQLAEIPPEIEWFANIDNSQTRRAYQNDLRGFMQFSGIHKPEDFRIVTRSHVLAWRKTLEEEQFSGASIRRKLAAPVIPVREQCGDAQSGQGGEAPGDGIMPGQNAAAGGCPGACASECSRYEHPQGQARPGDSLHPALPWNPARGAGQTQGERLQPDAAGRATSASKRQRRQDALCAQPPRHAHLDRRVSGRGGHGRNPDAPLFRPVKNNVHGHTYTSLTPGSVMSKWY